MIASVDNLATAEWSLGATWVWGRRAIGRDMLFVTERANGMRRIAQVVGDMPTWNADPIANRSTGGRANGEYRLALQVALPIAFLMIAAAALVFGVLWWTADD